ncbi:MFS transporter [Amycolatopsis sp. A133]|uniref:MFS transporter n=1 Tax=Amycolatopsis sp. A133 TaxID=3064472 RepID=UPI0027E60B96|nr:MFS transporter [Amycolatopsis sp. A133]MDQ7809146.1 MFS transporter [Amycolatopsis sp. A133]
MFAERGMNRLRVLHVAGALHGRPERFLATAMAVLYLGTGLSYSLLTLYCIRHLDLSPVAYGAGMSVAALLGIVSAPVMGSLADRYDGHRLYALLVWIMCVATAAIIVAPGWLALILLSVLTICGRGSAAVIGALIGRTVAKDRRIRYRAVVKTLSNSTMLIGLGLGALVLAEGSKGAFRLGFAAEALTFVVAGALVWLVTPRGNAKATVPDGEVRDQSVRRSRFEVLKDGSFAALTVLNGVLTLSESMLTIALPLWVSARMHAPLWLVSVAMVVYTVGIVILQIPASRGVKDVRTSVRASRRGGLLFAAAALVFPLAAVPSGLSLALGVVVLLAVTVVVGEVFYTAGSWGLVYELAPEESLGQYQGFFNIGFDLSMMLGPALFAWLVADQSMVGWGVLAAVFLVAALVIAPLSTRSRKNRPVEAPS